MSSYKIYTCGSCGAYLGTNKVGVCPKCKIHLIGERDANPPQTTTELVLGFIFLAIIGGLLWYYWSDVRGWFRASQPTDPYQGTWVVAAGMAERDGRRLSPEEAADVRVVIQGDRVEIQRLSAAEPDFVFTLNAATSPASLNAPQAQGFCERDKERDQLRLRYTAAANAAGDGQTQFVLKRTGK